MFIVTDLVSLSKHSVTKFSVISSVKYTQAFISFFSFLFLQSVSQSRSFYENNMILWYYQILQKNGLKSSAWIDGYDYQNKDKNISITKNKTLLCFPCSVS